MPGFAPTLALTTKPATWPAPSQPSAIAKSGDSGWDFSFHNLLGIINPLQHLPVIGTLYRAITGDKIAAPEKIAGDALYGGLWGAVSGIADVAFEAATGKDFGDTVLALFTGGDKKSATAVAENSPASAAAATGKDFGDTILSLFTGGDKKAPLEVATNSTPPTADASSSRPDVTALSNALTQKGIDSDTAQRALLAYRRSMAPQNTLLMVAQ